MKREAGLHFRHIDEKDVDLLIMDRVCSEGSLLRFLINEIKDEMEGDPSSYELAEVHHSAATRNGESDLLLTISDGIHTHALLIEDKIDAPAQYQQAKRYRLRGDDGLSAGD